MAPSIYFIISNIDQGTSDLGYFGTQLAFTKVHHRFPSLTPEDNNMKIKTNTKAGSAVWGG